MYLRVDSTSEWLTVNAPYPRCQKKSFNVGKTSCIQPVALAFSSRKTSETARSGRSLVEQVNMIRGAIKRQRNSAQLPYRSPDVVVESNFIVRCDQRPPVFS